MKTYYKPNVIFSIHGYNSHGQWQEKLTDCLSEKELQSIPYRYGKKIFRILPCHINKDVVKLRDWYFDKIKSNNHRLDISQPYHRPSVIAHSLGTWLLVKLLNKYPEVKFDKVILLGSIIPANFDWFKLILRDQVNSVVYEKALRDRVVPFGFIFTGSTRPCGTNGFEQKCSFVKEEELDLFGHSDFDYKAHLHTILDKRLYTTPHQLKAVNGRDLTERQINRYFKATAKIDKIVYPTEYQDSPISFKTAWDWFKTEKDIWSFVVNSYNDDILAYINAIPVDDKTYNLFCEGTISEGDIKPVNISDLETGESYNLLILSIAINNKIRHEETSLMKGRIVELLIMSFINKLEKYGAYKKLNKMAAYAWTPQGEKLCKGFCMTLTKTNSLNKPLYEVDFKKLKKINIKDVHFIARWWYKKYFSPK
jgi:hypothetical protein